MAFITALAMITLVKLDSTPLLKPTIPLINGHNLQQSLDVSIFGNRKQTSHVHHLILNFELTGKMLPVYRTATF